MLIVLSGAIGRSGLGGQAWVYLQYMLGLRALGHEVYYVEDCGHESWVYHWEEQQLTSDIDYPAEYVRQCIEPLGFAGRWLYRAGEQSRGMSIADLADVCTRADLLIVRAVPITVWRPEYDLPRRRVFIDVDPGFTQMALAAGSCELEDTVSRCEHLFTFGQRIGKPDCPIPTVGRTWLKTVPPVSLTEWPVAQEGPATHFTSIIKWRGFRDASYNGVQYGQRDKEFPRFIDLPRLTDQPFCLAVLGADISKLERHGWQAIAGEAVSLTPWSYRAFIQGSRAELGVAKHLYVETRCGWFSDRSLCYLASGRPVLVEDTGVADWLPVGAGVLTFRDTEEAVRGIELINSDYEHHRPAARKLAEEYFDVERVLPPLLDAAMS